MLIHGESMKISQWLRGFILLAAITLILGSCASSIKLTKTQRMTISPEAQEYYKQNRVVRLPALDITGTIARIIAAYDSRQHAPEVEKYRKEFNITLKRETIAGVPVVLVVPPDADEEAGRIGFYIHGGGFLAGEAADFFVMDMAHRLGIPIVSVDYTLSPKALFPQALEECFRVYETLVQTREGGMVIAFGVSAGGNLVLGTLLQARDAALAMPGTVVLCTPWADLTGSGDSYVSNDGRDILAWVNSVEKTVPVYAGAETDITAPLMSPIYADYGPDFPPCIITTGTRDLLLSDSIRLCRILKNAGVPVQLLIYEGMWHGFNTTPDIPEGKQCNDEIIGLLRDMGV